MKTTLLFLISMFLLSFIPNNNHNVNDSSISNIDCLNSEVSTFDFEQSFEQSPKSANMTDTSFKQIKNEINQKPTIYGEKWRVFMIEHRKVAQIVDGSYTFQFDELLSQNTDMLSPEGLESMQITTKTAFSQSILISSSVQVTEAEETTIGAGLEVPGVTMNTSKKLQTGKTISTGLEYSTTFANELEYTLVYNPSEIPVPENSSFSLATIGDYIEFKVRVYEEKYYWWGTYIVDNTDKTFNCRIYTFNYNSYYFSNGTHLSKTTRPYTI